MKLDFNIEEGEKLLQILELDEDGLLIRFHSWLCDEIGQDLLKHNIDSVEKERYVIYRKLEYEGAKRLHSLFQKEIAKALKKNKNG